MAYKVIRVKRRLHQEQKKGLAFLAFSSEFLALDIRLSMSAWIWWMSLSSFLLALVREALEFCRSTVCSLVSESSCSTCLWPLKERIYQKIKSLGKILLVKF